MRLSSITWATNLEATITAPERIRFKPHVARNLRIAARRRLWNITDIFGSTEGRPQRQHLGCELVCGLTVLHLEINLFHNLLVSRMAEKGFLGPDVREVVPETEGLLISGNTSILEALVGLDLGDG